MTGTLPTSLQAALCSLSIAHVDGAKIQILRTEAGVTQYQSGELAKARSTMRALLTLATLEPTGDRLTGSVVLALMN